MFCLICFYYKENWLIKVFVVMSFIFVVFFLIFFKVIDVNVYIFYFKLKFFIDDNKLK